MSTNQRIILRYRGEGHLRFELPKELLESAFCDRLTDALMGQLGIYRTTVYSRLGKLSIRYFPGLTDVKTIAHFLSAQVSLLEPQLHGNVGAAPTGLARGDVFVASDWIDRAIHETQETLSATGIVLRRLFGETDSANGPPRLMLEFFTDLLVLWLIKTHWHLITQHWLKRPWTFRYEWSASLYLIFLLVRSKKTKN